MTNDKKASLIASELHINLNNFLFNVDMNNNTEADYQMRQASRNLDKLIKIDTDTVKPFGQWKGSTFPLDKAGVIKIFSDKINKYRRY